MLRTIQVLRAVAALLVVTGHLQPLFVRIHPTLGFVGLGRVGVDLFFVISGFVMVYTTDRSDPAPALFAFRRITRIAPAYWLVTVAMFSLAVVAPGLLGASRPDPSWLFKSLAFIPFDKGDGTTNPLLPVGWSLNYEMAFYALFTAAMLAGRRWRYWIAGGVIFAVALPGLLGRSPVGPLDAFYTRPIIAEFAVGMAIGASFDGLPVLRPGWGFLAAGVLAGGFLTLLLASGLAVDEPHRVFLASVASAGVLVSAICYERGGNVAKAQAAVLVGDASFSIYLTHLFVTQAAVVIGMRLGVAGASAAALVVVAIGTVLLGGVSFHRAVELPITRWLKTRVAIAPAARAA